MRRWARFAVVPWAVVGLLSGLVTTVGTAAAPAGATACVPRLLVLSAMPLELDPILAQASIDPGSTVVLDNRYFVTGSLEGNEVILGLTGIGPENALATTSDAFSHFRCAGGSEISGVVFSGTSGGDDIGDVFVPGAWSYEGGPPVPTSPAMYQVAAGVDRATLRLEKTTPSGDPACVCGVAAGGIQTPVTVRHDPVVEQQEPQGGVGLTTDPFGGRALPCAPAGSDVFGCVPCREMDRSQLEQALALAQGVPAFLQPGFFLGYLASSTPAGTWMSEDDETAVVAQVAKDHGVPFIGFRAASDGPGNSPGTGGDPLMLPGFPAQFLVYRQLAADNAAAMTLAFLQKWAVHAGAAGA